MRIKYLKLKNWLLAAMAAVLGMNTACEVSGVDEYGCPEARYQVKGVVTNESGAPIQGIEVSMSYETVETDANGLYIVGNIGFPGQDTIEVMFKDVDGEQNGSYADTTAKVSFRDATFEGGDGHWNIGTATKEQNMTLRQIH